MLFLVMYVPGKINRMAEIAAARTPDVSLRAITLQEYHESPGFSPERAPTDRVGYRSEIL